LLSLMHQRRPDGTAVEVVVVDNEPEPNNRTGVNQFAQVFPLIFPFKLHYVHEPDQGISQARNAALTKALQLGADWIAFIDDDEEADAGWLDALYLAAVVHRADACHGRVLYTFPAGAAAWRCKAPWGDWADHEGAELDSAGTSNVIFRAWLVRRFNLTFCDELSRMGGEDVKFFRAFHDHGGRIVFSGKPIVTETVPWSRVTLRGFARKAHRNGALKVETARLNRRYKPRRFLPESRPSSCDGRLEAGRCAGRRVGRAWPPDSVCRSERYCPSRRHGSRGASQTARILLGHGRTLTVEQKRPPPERREAAVFKRRLRSLSQAASGFDLFAEWARKHKLDDREMYEEIELDKWKIRRKRARLLAELEALSEVTVTNQDKFAFVLLCFGVIDVFGGAAALVVGAWLDDASAWDAGALALLCGALALLCVPFISKH